MKTYLSGPITGIKNYIEKFSKAETTLESLGHDTINPVTVGNIAGTDDYWDIMRIDVQVMLHYCDKIFMLKGWEKSKGAVIEKRIAEMFNFEIIYQECFNGFIG